MPQNYKKIAFHSPPPAPSAHHPYITPRITLPHIHLLVPFTATTCPACPMPMALHGSHLTLPLPFYTHHTHHTQYTVPPNIYTHLPHTSSTLIFYTSPRLLPHHTSPATLSHSYSFSLFPVPTTSFLPLFPLLFLPFSPALSSFSPILSSSPPERLSCPEKS